MCMQGLLGIRIKTIRNVQTLLFIAIHDKLGRPPQHTHKREEREETEKCFLEEKCNQDAKQKYPCPHRTILKGPQ